MAWMKQSLAIRSSKSKKPYNSARKLQDLPTEILTNILTQVYDLSLDELPDSHPLVLNRPSGTKPYRPPAMTVLENLKPPSSLDWYGRQCFLWGRPGQWGPFFQVMFASKLLYEIAKPIRYKEVHVEMVFKIFDLDTDVNRICNRLVNTQVIQNFTKHIHLSISLYNSLPATLDLIKALKTLSHLQHVCITIKGDGKEEMRLAERGILGQDILLFFDLKIETLTLIWLWGGLLFYVDQSSNKDVDRAMTFLPSCAECMMQKLRTEWVKDVYTPSTWYRDEADNTPVIKNKPKHTHDWTTTRTGLENSEYKSYSQWKMDQFTFTANTSSCPSWNVWENPRNHPDQLNDAELKASRPLLEWRKGFAPHWA